MTATATRAIAGAVERARNATTSSPDVSIAQRREEIIGLAIMGLTVPDLRHALAQREAATTGLRPVLARRLAVMLVTEAAGPVEAHDDTPRPRPGATAPHVTSHTGLRNSVRWHWHCPPCGRDSIGGQPSSALANIHLRDHLEECPAMAEAREALTDAVAEAISAAAQAGVPMALIQSDIDGTLSVQVTEDEF